MSLDMARGVERWKGRPPQRVYTPHKSVAAWSEANGADRRAFSVHLCNSPPGPSFGFITMKYYSCMSRMSVFRNISSGCPSNLARTSAIDSFTRGTKTVSFDTNAKACLWQPVFKHSPRKDVKPFTPVPLGLSGMHALNEDGCAHRCALPNCHGSVNKGTAVV